MSVDLDQFTEVAEEKGVSLNMEQLHELDRRHADSENTVEKSVDDYIQAYDLHNLS